MGLNTGQTSNPLRHPDVLARIRAQVDADPVAATGSVIADLVKREFGISVTRNQISAAFSREGIKRGGYSTLTGEGRVNKPRLVDDGTLTDKQKRYLKIRDRIEQKRAKDRGAPPPAPVSPTPMELERAVIREQQRVVKASILVVPRASAVAPRERASQEVRVSAVRYEVPVTPRYGRVMECVSPTCKGSSEPGKSYCLACCMTIYVNYRPRPVMKSLT